MQFLFDYRPSDSPFVETIWRTQSERAGSFISRAEINWEMVVAKHSGKTFLAVRGPETQASVADFPADAEFFGIVFKLGTFMPHLPARKLLDRNDATLPAATSRSFWLHGSVWQFPNFENADTFIARLVREVLLVRDPIVDAALQGRLNDMSLRSVQRRFLHATGLSHQAIRQIERARRAAALLEQGVSIPDTLYETGYADQPHLTRALKRFIGQTPAQILRTHPVT
jgi:AraC-like DNA-binding protein